MNDKEKAELRAKTGARQPEFLSDIKEYDGRAAKQQWKREIQDDGKEHEKSYV